MNMHELTERELYQALEYAKSIDEDVGRKIITQFQLDHTAFAETIFGIFPTVIAEKDPDMAHFFMDLCFDVLCIFQKAFGPLPSQKDMDIDWVENQAMLLNAELQAITQETNMDDKIRAKLQKRLFKRAIDETPQLGLIDFMNQAIDEYASESPGRVPAIKVTQTMLFIVVRMFSNLYSHSITE